MGKQQANVFTPRAFLFLLYLTAVIASSFHSELKYQSLGFQTRDYAYYIQFSSRLLDSRMPKAFSLNPEGFNWLGYSGTEGAGNFHRSLHLEPVKYLYALLYYFAQSPRILFWFTALLFFLPLIYLAFAADLKTRQSRWFAALIGLLYVFYPASLLTPGFDLRPRVLLAPFFFMSLIAVVFSRPLWERCLWFNCMFLVREEALVLGASLILYSLMANGGLSVRKQTTICFSVAWVVWCASTLVFVSWTGYQKFPAYASAGLFSLVALCVVILLALAATYWQHLRGPVAFPRFWQIAAYSFVFIPFAFKVSHFEEEGASSPTPAWIAQIAFNPQYTLYFVALLGLVLVWRKGAGKASARSETLVLSTVIAVFLALGIFSSSGLLREYARHLKEIPPARQVFSLRQSTDRHQSWILADYATYQAFSDYQHVYVYNRLPWSLAPGPSRYYPANKQLVQELVNERVEYIVVSKESEEAISELLSSGQMKPVRLFENERFFTLKLNVASEKYRDGR